MTVHRDPRTKSELVNRMMSYDFTGDFRNIGEEGVNVVRVASNKVQLHFKASGQQFELVVRKPAPTRQGINTRAVGEITRSFAPLDDGLPAAANEEEWRVSPEA